MWHVMIINGTNKIEADQVCCKGVDVEMQPSMIFLCQRKGFFISCLFLGFKLEKLELILFGAGRWFLLLCPRKSAA